MVARRRCRGVHPCARPPSRRRQRQRRVAGDVVDEMPAALRLFPQVSVLHHGWCHANHAADFPGSGKKSEYPAERHPVDVADELDEGRQRLRSLFGARALRIFVPPWNRLCPIWRGKTC